MEAKIENEQDAEEKKRLHKKEEQLRDEKNLLHKEKEQLRDKEKQLRDKEGKLLDLLQPQQQQSNGKHQLQCCFLLLEFLRIQNVVRFHL